VLKLSRVWRTALYRRTAGPYKYLHHFFPDGNTSYDMTAWQEDELGAAGEPTGHQAAYLVRSCPVMTIAVSRLRPDWLATEGAICSKVGLWALLWVVLMSRALRGCGWFEQYIELWMGGCAAG
jgi:hypothetical protein